MPPSMPQDRERPGPTGLRSATARRPAQPDEVSDMIGRDHDLTAVRSFLDEATVQGGSLLLTGEPGIGKSVLLVAAARHAEASGCVLLRAVGAQFGPSVSFSGLTQLLEPVAGDIGQLSQLHRAALAAALSPSPGPLPGLPPGTPADWLVLSNAVLDLLRREAAEHPVVMIIDDLPWLDRPSAVVLGFVARRLAGTRAAFLAAARSGEEGFFARSGLSAHVLTPLADAVAAQLLAGTSPRLPARLQGRVMAEAAGNPLALVELPSALRQPGTADREPPRYLPLSQRLQELFQARISQLPAATRRLLLLAALDSADDLPGRQAATPGGLPLSQLAPAEDARLVRRLDGTGWLEFAHPLIRSAVVALAPAEELRRAHLVLADQHTGQPERRAWHLADAADGPDEQVAVLLEDTAHLVRQRGDAVGAVDALLRAADLSPAGASRSRRLARAALVGAAVTAETRSASALLAEAHKGDPDLGKSLHAAVATVFLLLHDGGQVGAAHQLLTGAIQAYAGPREAADTALTDALLALLLLCFFSGRAEMWEPLHAAISQLKPQPPEALYLVSQTQADPARLTPAILRQIDAAIADLHDEADFWHILQVSSTALYTDRLAGCREPLWRVIRAHRAGRGSITPAVTAMTQLFIDDWLTGRWDEAQQLTDEASALCPPGDYPLQVWMVRHRQAILAAARGSTGLARQLMEEMTRWAAPRGVGIAVAAAHHAGSLAALGEGDFERAYHHAAAISPPGILAPGAPFALWVALDLVEAAVRTGRPAEASAHVAVMSQTGLASVSPRLALVVAGCAALSASGYQATALFEQALDMPGGRDWPFDLARIQLGYGEHLRRARTFADARYHLAAALAIFQRLGASGWTERAGSELRAAGHPADAGGLPALSSQEHEIALLAAAGLTNKEIGERLYLSHRTVGAYLYRIFPKLGITSRAALRDALERQSSYEVGSCHGTG
jgi:DNA-binding CsgD family transcriptional regulator